MYDYVIVGAGSAGCVLANRLTADGSARVLLLEAGGKDRDARLRVPAAFPRLFGSRFDWAYRTEPQPHLEGRTLRWASGKVLGGSSSLNAMVYCRGNPRDYDCWRNLGNPGWGFADLLPYFVKAEDHERGATAWHGIGGPLSVSDHRSIDPLSYAFVEAGIEMGLPQNTDFNSPDQEGIGFFQVTQRRGARHSTAAAYLRPALERPNLTLVTNASATRILVRKERAIGVEYLRNGRTRQADAAEVLLCGGAVKSPQLLLLSGIGPAQDLEQIGIASIADLPGVGRNLQDHLFAAAVYGRPDSPRFPAARAFGSLLQYHLLRRGPATSNGFEAGAFVNPDSGRALVELLFAPAGVDGAGEWPTFTIAAVLEYPLSRGSITLRSTSAADAPAIQPNYLGDPADVEVLAAGVALARKLADAEAFDPYRGPELRPGPNVREPAQVRQFIRSTAESCNEPFGTCRMGQDSTSVVDPHLRVHGIDGLRIADASIIPASVSGHLNATVVMIGEKAADLILESRAPANC